MAKKYAAFGTQLVLDGTPISSVRSIGGPGLSADTIDVTTHDSVDAWEEVVVSLLRSGEVSLELIYDPADADHIALLSTMVGRGYEPFALWFPDDSQTAWEFDAFVTGFEPSGAVDAELMANVTLKITGVPVLNSSWSI